MTLEENIRLLGASPLFQQAVRTAGCPSAAANGGWPSHWQNVRLVAAVAELGSLGPQMSAELRDDQPLEVVFEAAGDWQWPRDGLARPSLRRNRILSGNSLGRVKVAWPTLQAGTLPLAPHEHDRAGSGSVS